MEEHRKRIQEEVKEISILVKEIDPTLSVQVLGLWAHATQDPKIWVVEKV